MDSTGLHQKRVLLERAAFGIILVACTLVPFIFFPKHVIYRRNIDMYDSFTYYKTVAQYILAVLSLFVIIGHGVVNYIENKKFNVKMCVSLMLFTIWAAVATCLSEAPSVSLFGYVMNHQGFLSHASYFIMLILTVNLFDKKYLKVLIYCVLASSSLMALLALTEFMDLTLIEDLFSNGSHFATRVHTTIGNSNRVGSYFSLMVPLSVIMFLRSEEKKERICLLFFALASIVGLEVSMSRISMISVLISCSACLFMMERGKSFYKRIALLLALSLAVTVFLGRMNEAMLEHYSEAGSQIRNLSSGEVRQFGSSRVYLYEKFIKLTLENGKNALVGVGPDCLFLHGRVSKEDRILYPKIKGLAEKAHSDLLEYASTMGIPALVLYLCFLGTTLFAGMRRSGASPELAGIFAGWLGYMGQSFFNVPAAGLVAIFYIFSAILSDYSMTL